MKKCMKKWSSITIRIEADLKEKIQEAADKEFRSLSNFITLAVCEKIGEIPKVKT